MEEERNRKVRRYLEDKEGDKAKRLTSTIFLISTIVVGGLITGVGLFLEIKSPELVKFVFGGLLSGCLLSLGYTIPEMFNNVSKK